MRQFLPAFGAHVVDINGDGCPQNLPPIPKAMRVLKLILMVALLGVAPLAGLAATMEAPALNQAASAATQAAGAKEEHGLPPKAGEIFRIGPLPVTNSMLVSWVVAIGLIVFAQAATRNIQEIPSGIQNFWEWLVESLYNFLEGIIGRDLVKKTFWFFASLFIFILFANWFGLVPGVGTIGWGRQTPEGFLITDPWIRGVNADLNMTFAMACVFFACWIVWAFQANGPIGLLKHLFAPKGESSGPLKILLIVVFFAVGFLEIFSILFRPVSLSFRLYGNIFAGENMLEAMSNLIKEPAWLRSVAAVVVPIPFYFMELLVGVIQALVFMLLTAVFTMLITQHDEGSAHGHAHH
jgi:F-type H+-transporting ATPase subunit a